MLTINARVCALKGCGLVFKPKRSWQVCCSKEHSRKMRYLRRKERVEKAMKLVRVNDSIAGSDG